MSLSRWRVLLGWVAGLLCAWTWAAEPGPVGRASEQRMLAQRVVKAYSQIGLNVLPTAAMNQLTEALAGFDANLLALDSGADDDAVKKALSDLALAWQPLRAGAMSPVSRERALALSRATDAVENSARKLVQVLQDRTDTPTNRLVSMAGRQSMLCQRIAKAYMLLSWGVEAASLREELDAAVNEFSGGLATLRSQRENGPEVGREIEEMALQWEWLQNAIAAEGASSYRLIVAEATESILVSTRRIGRMYEDAGKH